MVTSSGDRCGTSRLGLGEEGLPRLGRFLAVLFAVMCIGGSFGGGNMFQANQSYAQVAVILPVLLGRLGLTRLRHHPRVLGRRRDHRRHSPHRASRRLHRPDHVRHLSARGLLHHLHQPRPGGPCVRKIVTEAFTPRAGFGGMAGVLITGFRRAAFSNEAGVGSASIAHSAAATDEPVREGIVALLEPFIDTIIVCTMTGLVVVITGAYEGGRRGRRADDLERVRHRAPLVSEGAEPGRVPVRVLDDDLVELLRRTLLDVPFRPAVLHGLQGDVPRPSSSSGAVLKLGNVIDFSDLMILGMSFPNILGAVLLSGKG